MNLRSWFGQLLPMTDGEQNELERFRRRVFEIGLVSSALCALAFGFGPQREFIREDALDLVRAVLLAYVAAHLPLHAFGRSRHARLAHLAFLFGAAGVTWTSFRLLRVDPFAALGMNFAYHSALILIGVLLLRFRPFFLFASVIGALRLVTTGVQFCPLLGGGSAAILLSDLLPLVLVTALSVLASYLLQRYHQHSLTARQELADHNERLEREVAQRTELIEKQREQMFQMQKMEAIGTLAAGIAHDFNNLLTPILGFAGELKRISEPGEEVREAAEVIERAGSRAALLTHQLLGFARKGLLQRVPVDLHQVVRDVASFVSRGVEPQITPVLSLCASRATVRGDPSQLQQIVLNLAVNAREAMQQGGAVTFVTEELRLDEPAQGLNPGRYLRLSVQDAGRGIAPELRSRIFEPFFTTKPQGEGTGMGLAMAYGIAKNHGGVICVESTHGAGSRFDVYLPCSEEEATTREAPAESFAQGKGRVLLVDDDELVLRSGNRLLEALGYQVALAHDGVEALDYYRVHRGEVDVVVLDLLMPRLDGYNCFRRLLELDPDVRVIISSGYGLNGSLDSLTGLGLRGFVQKPYAIAELAKALATAIRA